MLIQDRVITRALDARPSGAAKAGPPWPLRLLRALPLLRRVPARVIGLGFRPEHIRTPDIHAAGWIS